MSDAKVTPPSVSRPGLVPRERLFERLDRALERGAAWVRGPAGAGKTTLVASWIAARGLPALWVQVDAGDADPATFFQFLGLALRRAQPRRRRRPPAFTPERMAALGAFTRGWFEHLGGASEGPVAIVLDDLHDVPAGSPLDEVLRVAFASAPRGSAVVGVSRAAPPPPILRSVAAGSVVHIGPEDLSLDDAEAGAIVLASGTAPGGEGGPARRLREQSQGWAVGLAFLLDAHRSGGGGPPGDGGVAREGLFHYLAAEVLARVDGETRALLLRTAHLPGFTAALARDTAGVPEAAAILARLARDGTFTRVHEGEPRSYSYHPLFRDFLLETAGREIDADARRRLFVESAARLALEGRPHAGASLLRQAEAWPLLAALAARSAPELVAEGRAQTLAEWLRWLPEEVVSAEGWLLYWRAVCVFAPSPIEAHGLFARALERFRERGDAAGGLLAWSGAVCSIWGAWRDLRPLDAWVRTGEELIAALPCYPSPDVELEVASAMCVALAFRQPANPAMARWRARVLELASGARKVLLRAPFASMAIVMHDLFHRGAPADAAHAVAALLPAETDAQAPVLVRTIAEWGRATVLFFEGRFAECRRAVEAGLRIVEESEVRWFEPHLLCLLVLCDLVGPEPAQGRSRLEAAEARLAPDQPVSHGFVHLVAAWFALATGDARAAWTRAERLARIQDDVGMVLHAPLFDLVRGLARHDLGERVEARAAIERSRAIARESACPFYAFAGALAAAEMDVAEGREAAALTPLAEALAFGRERGFAVSLYWRRDRAARLLALALAEGIDAAFARRLVEVHGLAAEPPSALVEAWPWRVRIRALGGLAVEVDGRPLPPEALKGRPAELLQALIASGGSKVPETTLTDALWPESDAEAAHSAFSTNLQRLRKLLGAEGALVLVDGRLSLDPRLAWIDVRALESACDAIEAAARATPPLARAELERWGERLLSLYQGPFLEDERGAGYAGALRMRLEARFRRKVAALGQRLEGDGAREAAASLYARALERDDLAEHLYERLATLEIEMGRPAEALAVCARAEAALRPAFGVEPGEALRRVAERARGGR